MKRLLFRKFRKGSIALEFKAQDLWIGLFWRSESRQAWDQEAIGYVRSIDLDLWIVLIPTLPLHLHLLLPGAKAHRLFDERELDAAQAEIERLYPFADVIRFPRRLTVLTSHSPGSTFGFTINSPATLKEAKATLKAILRSASGSDFIDKERV